MFYCYDHSVVFFFVNLNQKLGRNLKTYWRNLTKLFLKIVTENVMLRIYSLPLPFINCISFLYIEFNYLLYFLQFRKSHSQCNTFWEFSMTVNSKIKVGHWPTFFIKVKNKTLRSKVYKIQQMAFHYHHEVFSDHLVCLSVCQYFYIFDFFRTTG